MKVVGALLLSCALVSGGQAAEQKSVATLQDLNGKVLMNKGSGLVSGTPGTDLKDGDRIVTLDKSGARIVFPDGCTVTLEENKMFEINAELGCKVPLLVCTPAPIAVLPTTEGLVIGGTGAEGATAIGSPVSKNSSGNRPGSSVATLHDMNGKVLMNKGSGLVSGKTGADLKDGDRVVTLDKSGAKVVFNDGCTVTIEENKIFEINAELGCRAALLLPCHLASVAVLPATRGLFMGAASVGTAAAIGNAIFNNNDNGDNRPISPQ